MWGGRGVRETAYAPGMQTIHGVAKATPHHDQMVGEEDEEDAVVWWDYRQSSKEMQGLWREVCWFTNKTGKKAKQDVARKSRPQWWRRASLATDPGRHHGISKLKVTKAGRILTKATRSTWGRESTKANTARAQRVRPRLGGLPRGFPELDDDDEEDDEEDEDDDSGVACINRDDKNALLKTEVLIAYFSRQFYELLPTFAIYRWYTERLYHLKLCR